MTAVPPPTPPQPGEPAAPAPAQYQQFVPQAQPYAAPQPGVAYPQQPGVAYPAGYAQQPGVAYPQGYPQQGNPQFPNGVQASPYRPGDGLTARVRGNYRWAFWLFALPGIIGIPIFIGIIIWANIVT